jgi:GMP synthase (glutamine-hydrolysing)
MKRIAILDCGAQYTKVIDRRIRELNVATELFPLDVNPALLSPSEFAGIILSGGPHSVYDAGAPRCDVGLFELGLPVLGICYGMQLMAQVLGGEVTSTQRREYGETNITLEGECALFKGLASEQLVLMSHGDSVTRLPEGFKRFAVSKTKHESETLEVTAAMAHSSKPWVGVQFHPEVELTENGQAMLSNFLFEVCKVTPDFDLNFRLDAAIEDIRKQVGQNPVFVLMSGGVDSSVVAALLLKALPAEQVYGLHMDTGFMRENESDLVCESLKALGFKHLKRLDAATDFLNGQSLLENGETTAKLCQLSDPELKRRVIGDVFFQLLDAEMKALLEQLGHTQVNEAGFKLFMAQGTLRPDLIESGNKEVSQTAQKIKTHHNDVPVIQAMREQGLVVEPNRDLHKDEVRQIGRMLGLPEALVIRQPFPGPGLAVRTLCATEAYDLEHYDELNSKLQALLKAFHLTGCVLPVRSVGVQGDGRTYAHVAAVQCPNYDEPKRFEEIRLAAQEVANRLKGINRLALNLLPNETPLPQQVKQITPTLLNAESAAKLRRLDSLVSEAFMEANAYSPISQLLTVLLPVDLQQKGGHSLVIRGVVTSDFMTARPARVGKEIPVGLLPSVARRLIQQQGVSAVFYDITGKPPATVEWE